MRKRGLRIDVMLNEIEYKKLMDDVEREKTSYSEFGCSIHNSTFIRKKKLNSPVFTAAAPSTRN